MVTKPHDGVKIVDKVVHYVRANGRSVLAQITALGAGDLVDLAVLPSRAETFDDVDLLADPGDTDVWYKSSRRHP
jgi:hypothetical protein